MDRQPRRIGRFGTPQLGMRAYAASLDGLTVAPQEQVGTDLGLRQSAVTSEGERLEEGRYYRGLESAIAMAQRRGHNGRRSACTVRQLLCLRSRRGGSARPCASVASRSQPRRRRRLPRRNRLAFAPDPRALDAGTVLTVGKYNYMIHNNKHYKN